MGVLIGPAITFFALAALWKNETRFNFFAAANQTPAVESAADATDGQSLSLTGPMDQELTMAGDYVKKLTGYLRVNRSAEIYAWDRDEDSDDHVTWRKEWMSSLESNSRNHGLNQTLSGKEFQPPTYHVGELEIQTEKMEFVDSTEHLNLGQLELVKEGLRKEGNYFYLRKAGVGSGHVLGDERVRYTGIPVPATATYFGKYQSGQGVADTSQERTGWINTLIQDSGVLHHLVAGDRTQALASMKAYLGQLKWIVRGIGTVACVVGMLILFSSVFRFLYGIPVIGWIAESGSVLFALAIGIPLAVTTILVAYLFANPFVLLGIGLLIAAVLYFFRRRANTVKDGLKDQLNQRYGHELQDAELKEIEFVELAQFALADGNFDEDESKFLQGWAKKHGWPDDKYRTMLEKAKSELAASGVGDSPDDRLSNLIRLALADGKVSFYELKTIRSAAKQAGYDDATIRELTDRVRESAAG